MTCDRFLEDVMNGRRSEATIEHLRICPDCRSRAAAMESVGERLRDPLLWEEAPPDLGARVVAAVTGDIGSEGRHRHRWWWAAVAAAVAALVVGLVLSMSLWPVDPDWELELVAGAAAPAATGTVIGFNEDGATRMVFDVTGFETAPEDSYYEVWLTAEDGRHVSAGTFRAPGRIEVMAGVRRQDFPRVWITLEPADDDPTPARATILDSPSA